MKLKTFLQLNPIHKIDYFAKKNDNFFKTYFCGLALALAQLIHFFKREDECRDIILNKLSLIKNQVFYECSLKTTTFTALHFFPLNLNIQM